MFCESELLSFEGRRKLHTMLYIAPKLIHNIYININTLTMPVFCFQYIFLRLYYHEVTRELMNIILLYYFDLVGVQNIIYIII